MLISSSIANAIALSPDDDDDDEDDDDDDDDDEEDDEEEAKPKDAKMEVDGGKSLNFGAIRQLIGLVVVLVQVTRFVMIRMFLYVVCTIIPVYFITYLYFTNHVFFVLPRPLYSYFASICVSVSPGSIIFCSAVPLPSFQ